MLIVRVHDQVVNPALHQRGDDLIRTPGPAVSGPTVPRPEVSGPPVSGPAVLGSAVLGPPVSGPAAQADAPRPPTPLADEQRLLRRRAQLRAL